MNSKLYLEEIPEQLKEEIVFLYNLGISIDDLEYLIQRKFLRFI